MDWSSPGQLLGYLGVLTAWLNLWRLGRVQRSDSLYWMTAALSAASWAGCGWLIGSPAVLIEAVGWGGLAARGWWRYGRGLS